MENRLLALVTGLSLAVGLVFGIIAGALLNTHTTTPVKATVHLDQAEQDDFIIAVAEAYADDHNMTLAQDRLARLHSQNISARVEKLATHYTSQRDVIAVTLARLAVALGSDNSSLRALNLFAESTNLTGDSARAELAADANTTSPISGLAELQPIAAPQPAAPAPLASLYGGIPSVSVPTQVPASFDLPESRAQRTSRSSPDLPKVNPPTATPTRATASNSKSVQPKPPTPDPARVVSTIALNLTEYASAPALSIPLHATPSSCTPASQLPAVVDHTISLCAGQEYPPFRVNGNNLTIYGDPGGSARIHAPGRAFGITVNGSNITITGVHIVADTDPADQNIWLCLYDNCTYKGLQVRGGTAYGGGILLDGTTNVAVISSTVSSGVIGVASVHGSQNKIVNNNLSNLNGWGAYVFYSDDNAVVGNTMNDVTRSCLGPDGASYATGCESAGIAVIRAQTNLFVNNHCERSGDCVYAPGLGGYSSNKNMFLGNYCAASPHNCFEITFSTGNQFDYNVATSDPNTGIQCTYPFWISGSAVDLGPHNTWDCKFTAQEAFAESQRATEISTAASGF